MSYCDRSDIVNVYGEENVEAWSQLEDPQDFSSAADDRVAAAISYAGEYIDDFLRGGEYEIPIVGNAGTTPRIIVDVAAKLAGIWLYTNRHMWGRDETNNDGVIASHQEYCTATLMEYSSRRRRLNAVLAVEGPSAPRVVKRRRR